MLNKKVNGYLTVEASFVVPFVLFLYLLVILLAFFLYNRCVISQDLYLLALRGSRFTDQSPFYGEVIYGEMEEKEVDTDYLQEALTDRLQYYPFYQQQDSYIHTDGTYGDIEIGSSGYGDVLTVKKRLERLNIREEIRKVRQRR